MKPERPEPQARGQRAATGGPDGERSLNEDGCRMWKTVVGENRAAVDEKGKPDVIGKPTVLRSRTKLIKNREVTRVAKWGRL